METHESIFKIPNIRLFIAFRIFFNARFYYPIFTILFLDYGLTIEQFAILNSVWAATIVLAEVPSGALADTFGRKTLLYCTAFLMFFELAVISFVPLDNITIVFWAFLINRVLSGLAEAMASGADEAIAYDSLVELGKSKEWPKVLSVQMRVSSIASILTATTGALIYDTDVVNFLLRFFGSDIVVSQQTTMRFPVFLTLILSLLAIFSVSRMREINLNSQNEKKRKNNLVTSFLTTISAGGWILKTPFAFAVILVGMTIDHVIRMMVTMTSQYFRLIDLPEATFGIIGGAMSMLGLIIPKVAEKMAEKFSPLRNALIISMLTVTGFAGLSLFLPYFGILPMALLFSAIMMTSFFTSHYLNSVTESHQRATVLSFKGLAFNLGYGSIGILFALLMRHTRNSAVINHPEFSQIGVEDMAFTMAVNWFAPYTILALGLISFFCFVIFLRRDKDC